MAGKKMKSNMMRNGYPMLETTIGAVWDGTAPDDMEDMYVIRPGNAHLSEVWDFSIDKEYNGKITIFGGFPDTPVSADHVVYYTDFSGEVNSGMEVSIKKLGK